MKYRVLASLNNFFPKKDIILFYSTVDFSDNPFYLYKRIMERGFCEDYECVWIVNTKEGKKRVENFGGKAILRSDKYALIKYILKSKYFVSANGPPAWKSKNQISIELWHGIPIKSLTPIATDPDYFIVPSKFASIILSATLKIKHSTFLNLGQPRCDALFTPKKLALNNLSRFIDTNIDKYEWVMMYLPTFREYNKAATKEISINLISNPKFQNFLRENDVLFIVKPHPVDEKFFEEYSTENIKILKNTKLLNNFLTLYDVLPIVDILVTDYSSVYFDYLLLNRPIVFYVPDLEMYRKTRGFVLEPYEKWTPGDKARTIDELIRALDEAINNPNKWKKERLWLRDIMFKYKDGKSSERIIKYFWGG